MIPKETIDDIFQAARIEEVVGEYVHLKKRGVNLIGNCPFHDEKTPSFTVSPAKGIYKCFGCSAGGNSVNFLMEHEHYTYPEALRHLAAKYNIEIEEEEMSPAMQEEQSEREGMYIVANYAEKYFIQQLNETDQGKAIGLSYFKERGFSQETIDKFKLGYSPDGYDTFTKDALGEGYKQEFLVNSGLTKDKNNKVYDGYRGRVIFPIHNLSGRPIGFGGRTLKTDKKVPKYINSPENTIYNKSKVLYGIFHSKKEILKKDNCFLVEGYTDVISLHQAGVENVVASSGTSLTQDQIKLISRFTKNITILFDGDVAGIKASFRGINMILSEGMNVRVVLFPDGEDPDSFAKKSVPGELEEFISANSKDFIVFKTDLLLAETQGDPIKKANLIHEIVDSIALIPDQISRSVYVKECARLMDITEKVIISELNKQLRKKGSSSKHQVYDEPVPVVPFEHKEQPVVEDNSTLLYHLEQNIVRLLLQYGEKKVYIEIEENKQEVEVIVYVLNLLYRDDIAFENELYQKMLEEYTEALNEEKLLNQTHFLSHSNPTIQKETINLISTKYELHNWHKKQIYVESEEDKLRRLVEGSIHAYMSKRVEKMWLQNQHKLKTINTEDAKSLMEVLEEQKRLNQLKQQLSQTMGRIIVR